MQNIHLDAMRREYVHSKKHCLFLLLTIVCFLMGHNALAVGASVIPGDARTEEYKD